LRLTKYRSYLIGQTALCTYIHVNERRAHIVPFNFTETINFIWWTAIIEMARTCELSFKIKTQKVQKKVEY